MFAERDKHYPSRSGKTSLVTAVTNITKPVTKINFGPSTLMYGNFIPAFIIAGERILATHMIPGMMSMLM